MSGELLPRHLLRVALEDATGFRVVVINGPRQAGKSTLLQLLHEQVGGQLVTLDDRDALRAARTDPTGFVTEREHPLLIDEIQRGGNALVVAVKADIDRHPREPGRFFLTGSSRFLTVPSISESLAGRVRILDLWPLSQGELAGRREHFVDSVFWPPPRLRAVEGAALSRAQLFERVVLGGFPAVHDLPSARLRAAWFGDYVRTLLQRDLAELRRPGRLVDLPRLVQLVLARTGQELVMSSMASDLRLTVDTVKEYLGLLETLYLFHSVAGWSGSSGRRAIKRPKIHAVDTGLAAALLNTSVDELRRPESSLAGPLLETFVVGEFGRQLSWSETPVRLFHWRDRDGREVDLIAESSDGRVAGVEVKAARDVDEHDFRHLAALRDRIGERFVNGVVLHLGERSLAFGDRLTALPVSALWA
jgi:predicted AAA+ superfamily ATPase